MRQGAGTATRTSEINKKTSPKGPFTQPRFSQTSKTAKSVVKKASGNIQGKPNSMASSGSNVFNYRKGSSQKKVNNL